MTNDSLQKIARFFPPFVFDLLKKTYYALQFAGTPHKSVLRANAELHNAGKGKKAFLIGTGPSLKSMDLKLLAGQDCFSLSNFYLHEDLQTVNPRLHFFAPYHLPLDRNNFVDWLRDADRKLPADTNIVLGTSDYDMVQEFKLFPNRKIYYLHLTPAMGVSSRSVDLTRPVLKPQTSPLMIVPVLIYMGYTEIYLMGCDHNVLKYYREDIEHFYDVKRDVRKGASDKGVWVDIITQHEASVKVFRQYAWYIEKFSRKYNFRFINLSPLSWLDFVERDTLENAVRK